MAAFSKRQYIELAQALRAMSMPHRRFAALALADVLERDNPRFERERFLDDCGAYVHQGANENAESVP